MSNNHNLFQTEVLDIQKDVASILLGNVRDKLYLIPFDRQRQYSLQLNFIEKISSQELPDVILKWDSQ